MSEWDGKENRKQNNIDHDLLIRIDANLSNFLVEFKDHVKADENNFKAHAKEIEWMRKTIYLGLGALAMFQFLLNFIHH